MVVTSLDDARDIRRLPPKSGAVYYRMNYLNYATGSAETTATKAKSLFSLASRTRFELVLPP